MNILNQALREFNFNQNLRAMSHTISVLFYARKSRATIKGLIPIYMRISLEGERFNVTTKFYVMEEQWSIEAGKMKGHSEEAKRINSILDAMRARAFDYQRELLNEGKPLNMDTFKHKWLGIVTERPRMLLEIFEHHNKQMKELMDSEFSPLTYEATSLLSCVRCSHAR